MNYRANKEFLLARLADWDSFIKKRVRLIDYFLRLIEKRDSNGK